MAVTIIYNGKPHLEVNFLNFNEEKHILQNCFSKSHMSGCKNVFLLVSEYVNKQWQACSISARAQANDFHYTKLIIAVLQIKYEHRYFQKQAYRIQPNL